MEYHIKDKLKIAASPPGHLSTRKHPYDCALAWILAKKTISKAVSEAECGWE